MCMCIDRSMIVSGLESEKGNCFYLCGSPGTGKTATMNAIIQELNKPGTRQGYCFTLAKMNAMTLESPQSVYLALWQSVRESLEYDGLSLDQSITLRLPEISKDAHKAMAELDALFTGSNGMDHQIDRDSSMMRGKSKVTRKKKCNDSKRVRKKPNKKKRNLMFIVIVDEMDHLLSKYNRVLFRLFEWARRPGSNLLLLGIANSIDLTDRFIPRLRARKVEPKLLIFKPYDRDQLSKIIIHRLRVLNAEMLGRELDGSENDGDWEEEEEEEEGGGAGSSDSSNSDRRKGIDNDIPFFEDKAIQLCASKVAKTSGDIRKCLEICRSALRLIMDEKNDGGRENEKIMKVGFREMNQVIRQTFSSPMVAQIRDLPNKQKIVAAIGTLLMNGLNKIQQQKQNEMDQALIKQRRDLKTEMIIASKSSDYSSNTVSKGCSSMSRSISADMIRVNAAIVTMDKLERYYDAMCEEYSLSQATSSGEFSVIVNHLISAGIFTMKRSSTIQSSTLTASRKSTASMTRSRSSFENRILSPVTEIHIPVPIHEMEIACEEHYTLNELFNDPPPIPPRFQA